MLEEFKKFALRGNVVDLAVGVIIGAAFGAIVSAMVGHPYWVTISRKRAPFFPAIGFVPARSDAEPVAAALETDFLSRGVRLFKGAWAEQIEVHDTGVVVHCDEGRQAKGSHAL